jgi:hypothetical protein
VVGGLKIRWNDACCGEAEDGGENEELFRVRVSSRGIVGGIKPCEMSCCTRYC